MEIIYDNTYLETKTVEEYNLGEYFYEIFYIGVEPRNEKSFDDIEELRDLISDNFKTYQLNTEEDEYELFYWSNFNNRICDCVKERLDYFTINVKEKEVGNRLYELLKQNENLEVDVRILVSYKFSIDKCISFLKGFEFTIENTLKHQEILLRIIKDFNSSKGVCYVGLEDNDYIANTIENEFTKLIEFLYNKKVSINNRIGKIKPINNSYLKWGLFEPRKRTKFLYWDIREINKIEIL